MIYVIMTLHNQVSSYPISFLPLTQLQTMVSNIPRLLLLRGLCICYSLCLEHFPLNNHMAHSSTSFRSLLKCFLSYNYSIFLKKESCSLPPTQLLSSHLFCSRFLTALFTAHSITYLFAYCLTLPLKPMLHDDKGFAVFVHCSIPLCLEPCLVYRRD